MRTGGGQHHQHGRGSHGQRTSDKEEGRRLVGPGKEHQGCEDKDSARQGQPPGPPAREPAEHPDPVEAQCRADDQPEAPRRGKGVHEGVKVRSQDQHGQDARRHQGEDHGCRPADQLSLAVPPQRKHQQCRPDQVKLFLHRQRPERSDCHAHVKRQRQVFQVAETGEEGIADDALRSIPQDISCQFNDGVDAKEGDERR
ncbi:hypothetical protein D9M72_481950 [compost metagenome]